MNKSWKKHRLLQLKERKRYNKVYHDCVYDLPSLNTMHDNVEFISTKKLPFIPVQASKRTWDEEDILNLFGWDEEDIA